MLASLPSLVEGADTFTVLATWRTWLEVQYAPATVKHYWGAAMRFFTRHPVDMRAVTEEHIVDFIQSFPPRSPARRAYYQGLKALFGWAYRRGVIERDPVAGIKVASPEEKVPRSLSTAELAAVVDAAYRRQVYRGATLELLYFTAARVGELVTIAWDDVNEERVILHGHKSAKERVVDMTEGVHAALEALFPWSGTYDLVVPRAAETVWEWCRAAGKDAGIPRVHPHLIRATSATDMLRSGGRIHAVRAVLGHASIKTTQRYLADDEADRKQALDGLRIAR